MDSVTTILHMPTYFLSLLYQPKQYYRYTTIFCLHFIRILIITVKKHYWTTASAEVIQSNIA